MDVTGKDAETALDLAGVTVNKNAIPHDTKPPAVTSGIRLGTPNVTTRGMGSAEMSEIAEVIATVIQNIGNQSVMEEMNSKVKTLCQSFPIY
jgi:glycine hydroxymethyltransferase